MVLWWVPEGSAGANDRGGGVLLDFSEFSLQPVIFAAGILSMEWGAAGDSRLPEFSDVIFKFTSHVPTVWRADSFRRGGVVCGVPWGDGVRDWERWGRGG